MARSQVATELQNRAGVSAVQSAVTQMGWFFREQPTSDFGIDAHIELVTGGRASGQLVALQIKSGESFFREESDAGIVFRGELGHLDYWTSHVLPVLLVLHDPRNGDICWQHISDDTVERTDRGWKTTLKRIQRLVPEAKDAISALFRVSPYERRRTRLLLDLGWMELLRTGTRLFVHATEWVNKSSGRGEFTFLKRDAGEDEDTVIDEWPFVMFPGGPYPSLFSRIFPWAEVAIDSDFYDQYEDEQAIDLPVWLLPDPDWERDDEPKNILPYESNDEVASYRLELRLNSLGKAFLEVNAYLTTGEPPTPGR